MTAATEPITTESPDPKRRNFFPQTAGRRAAGFWWSIVRTTLFRWSPPPLDGWRRWLLRRFGADVHASVRISPSVRVDFPWNLAIDRDVVVAHKVIINCMGRIKIGAGTWISQYAHLCAGTHDYRRRDMRIVSCEITIGKGVWIAADAFVGPDVTIGERCLLAARSSAFSDLPAGHVCMGEPAKPCREWGGIGTATTTSDPGTA